MPHSSISLPEFIARWKESGAAERANCQPFLLELCDVLGVERPHPAQADDEHNAYVFERTVTFHNPDGTNSPGRIAPQQVAAAFKRGNVARIAELLQTLVSLGQAREVSEGRYAP